MTVFSNRMTEQSEIAAAVAIRTCCPAKHPSPKKSPSFNMATTAFFPCLETTKSLTLPDLILFDIENGVCRVALTKDMVVGTVFNQGLAAVGLGQQNLQIEMWFCHRIWTRCSPCALPFRKNNPIPRAVQVRHSGVQN